MKSDLQLQKDVIEELRWDPSVHEKEIGVAVKDGVVTVTGSVASFAEKWAAERAIERIAGVRALADELTVKLSGDARKSDTELAHKAADALRWDVMVPDDTVKAKVVDGWLTLEGEVEWAFQRDAAMRAVRNLLGVKGVTSLVTVKPSAVSVHDVSVTIQEALRRRAEQEAKGITVTATDSVVTLRGKVPTWADRRAVEGAAWSAPGVREIRDEILVGL